MSSLWPTSRSRHGRLTAPSAHRHQEPGSIENSTGGGVRDAGRGVRGGLAVGHQYPLVRLPLLAFARQITGSCVRLDPQRDQLLVAGQHPKALAGGPEHDVGVVERPRMSCELGRCRDRQQHQVRRDAVGCDDTASSIHDSNDSSHRIVNVVPRSSTNSRASCRVSWVPRPITVISDSCARVNCSTWGACVRQAGQWGAYIHSRIGLSAGATLRRFTLLPAPTSSTTASGS